MDPLQETMRHIYELIVYYPLIIVMANEVTIHITPLVATLSLTASLKLSARLGSFIYKIIKLIIRYE